MKTKRKVTLPQLKQALASKNGPVRYHAIFDYAHSEVAAEAIPTLLEALQDKDPGVVRYAAQCLGSLGSEALSYGKPVLDCPQVVWELQQAACAVDRITSMPQAYNHCLEALLRLDPKSDLIVGLIHDHIGITNWYFIKASLQALKTVGTKEALDLLARSAAFWMPELDKKQKRIIQEIVDGKR